VKGILVCTGGYRGMMSSSSLNLRFRVLGLGAGDLGGVGPLFCSRSLCALASQFFGGLVHLARHFVDDALIVAMACLELFEVLLPLLEAAS
jgi:hypothetical protein